MSSNSENNKRIAKNTLLLYIRMILLMVVTLYTSRVVLQVLGIEDFGIFNVVGGVVTMFAFINGGMVSATQRYLTFELGRYNKSQLSRVFSTSLQIHAVISLIVVVLAETIGLWFFYNKMVIPADRMVAAMWVYQCSVVACVINIMSIPYNADIIAHEKMSAFAYISIFEASMKLFIVLLLVWVSIDKLVVYAILILLVQLIIRVIYSQYCYKHFEESRYVHRIDVSLFKEMAFFAGWSFWGNLAGVLSSQGLNMMLNVFFGPVVNAARGIAVQVQGAVQQFIINFQMALNPQITKNYAIANIEQMHELMFRSARFSFFLLFFLTLPFLLETNFLLTLWLNNVPENSVVFTQMMICISLLSAISNPCVVANQATGEVKKYQMVVGGLLLTILPISYLVLLLGAPAYSVLVVHFSIESIAQFSRLYILKRQIKLSIRTFFVSVYFPIIITSIFATIIPVLLHYQFNEGWLRFIVVTLSSMVSVFLFVWFLGLHKNERAFIFQHVLFFIKKRNKNGVL